jgi:hypothetical protein
VQLAIEMVAAGDHTGPGHQRFVEQSRDGQSIVVMSYRRHVSPALIRGLPIRLYTEYTRNRPTHYVQFDPDARRTGDMLTRDPARRRW